MEACPMKAFQTSSIAHMKLLQKACETLVVINTEEVKEIRSESDRNVLNAETAEANQMVAHLRDLIADIEKDN